MPYPTSQNIILIVCDTQANAENRKGYLEDPTQGYVVTIETVTGFIGYDSAQYCAGVQDNPSGRWLVIGRKATP